jgi:putative restriction endonuclease
MDRFAEGNIKSDLVELSPDLGNLFTLYWARVMPPHQHGSIALPFFHLKSEGFWHLIPKPGHEAFVDAARQIRSVYQLRDTVLGARIDNELHELLCVDESRDLLRTILLEKYFSTEIRPRLIEQGEINLESFQYSIEILNRARERQMKEQATGERAYRPAARDQGFRRAVTTAYDHRCAFCGIRLLTPDGHTVVDAAHIVPWNISHNDDPRNGMALCRLCHWTFDEGLVGISSRYTVITSPQLTTDRNVPGQMVKLVDRTIIGPSEDAIWPDLAAIEWHRLNVFRKR